MVPRATFPNIWAFIILIFILHSTILLVEGTLISGRKRWGPALYPSLVCKFYFKGWRSSWRLDFPYFRWGKSPECRERLANSSWPSRRNMLETVWSPYVETPARAPTPSLLSHYKFFPVPQKHSLFPRCWAWTLLSAPSFFSPPHRCRMPK